MSESYVPLPEVPAHTDSLRFDNLRFPVGFDEERLLVNIPAFKRMRAAAGISELRITVGDSTDEQDISTVGSITPSGEAAAVAGGRIKYQPLATSNIGGSIISSEYGWFGGTVTKFPASIFLDGGRMRADMERASGPGQPVNERDADLRARTLNKAIRTGLIDASHRANLGMARIFQTGLLYGPFASYLMTNGMPLEPALLWGWGYQVLGVAQRIIKRGDETVNEAAASIRLSLVTGIAPERYLAAAAVIGTHRFIKAAR
jgi:hypothetical protein